MQSTLTPVKVKEEETLYAWTIYFKTGFAIEEVTETEEKAKILAQADRINHGLSYTDIVRIKKEYPID